MPPPVSIARDLVLLAIASLAAPVLNAVAVGAMVLGHQQPELVFRGQTLVMAITAMLATPSTVLLGFPIARLLYGRGRLSPVQLIVLSSCLAVAVYLAIFIVLSVGQSGSAGQPSPRGIAKGMIEVLVIGALGAGVAFAYLWLRKVWGGVDAASV